MPQCQAYGCNNQQGKGESKGKGFYKVPDGNNPEKRTLATQWLRRIGTGFSVDSFTFNTRKLVCEDHFVDSDFYEDSHIKMCKARGVTPKYRRALKPDAVPSVFVHRPMKVPTDREARTRAREHSKVAKQLFLRLESSYAEPACNTSVGLLSDSVQDTLNTVNEIGTDHALPMETEQTEEIQLPASEIVEPSKQRVFVEKEVQTDPVLIVPLGTPICTHRQQEKIANLDQVEHDHTYCQAAPPNPHLHTPGASQTPASTFQTSDTPVAPVTVPDLYKTPRITPKPILSSTPSKPQIRHDIPMDTTLELIEEIGSHDLNETPVDHTDQSYIPNPSDETFDCPMETDPSVTEHSVSIVEEEKYLVFWGNLESLLHRIRCPEEGCDSPTDYVTKSTRGSCVDAKVFCLNGHVSYQWSSQPQLGKMPAGNFLLCGSILCSGATYTRIAHMASLMNLKFVSDTIYYMVQSKYLIPTINDTWYRVKRAIVQELKGKDLFLAGDGRCDSPGYSAKYCTYSLLDQKSKKVLEIQQVQKTETENKSTRMEVVGFQRAMDSVIEDGLTVKVVATDRHVSIRKVAREKYKPMGVSHEFDVHHLCSSIRKDMKAKSQKSDCHSLAKWMQFLNNHLWYSARSCNGDSDLLVEIWNSITEHVVNCHSFPNNKLFKVCGHHQLTAREARRKVWMQRGSAVHKAFCEVVLKKQIQKDIRMLANFCHTGALESFHNVILKYAPKRQEFDFCQMQARMQLAALDTNHNAIREQATVQRPVEGGAAKGEARYRVCYKRNQGKHVVEPVKVPKDYSFARDILQESVEIKIMGEDVPAARRPSHIPQSVSGPAPATKKEMIAAHCTRFGK